MEYNVNLSHIRFFAAMLIFLFHSYNTFHGGFTAHSAIFGFGWISDGYSGVTLFFVLSGYLFMMKLLSSDSELPIFNFYINRLLRIFPLFLTFLFLSFSLGKIEFRPYDFLYIFATNLGKATTSDFVITGVLWTISIELTFYLVFPFLGKFAKENGLNYLIKMIFLLLVIRLAAFVTLENPVPIFYTTLIGRFDQFIVGMGASMISYQYFHRNVKPVHVLVSATIVWSAIEIQAHYSSFFGIGRDPFWIFWPLLEACCWASLIACYSNCIIPVPNMCSKIFDKGGEISFSIYVWHMVVIFPMKKMIDYFGIVNLHFLVPMLLSLLITWFISNLSYEVIEAPFLKMKKIYS